MILPPENSSIDCLRDDTRVAPSAIVRESVVLGEGTAVWAHATIHHGVRLGAYCSVGELTYIGRDTTVGDRTRIGAQCHVTDRMVIGERVFIGPMVTFSNDRHPMVNNPRFKPEPPIVEDDVSIGINATILPGVRLGQGCTVGAGAVVTKDVEPYTTVVGCPARPVQRPISLADALLGQKEVV